VVFDITSEDSLKDAKEWLEQFVLHCGKEVPKILIGTKCDLLQP
jgi:GTPase SAR1 family protein